LKYKNSNLFLERLLVIGQKIARSSCLFEKLIATKAKHVPAFIASRSSLQSSQTRVTAL